MKPKRTGVTGLSENALLILDFLAMLGRTNVRNLFRERYSTHLNTGYSHDLNNKELLLLLDELECKSLVSKKPSLLLTNSENQRTSNQQIYDYYLTEKGGVKWSVERSPIWNKYCVDATNAEGTSVEFRCTDQKIGRQFAEVSLLVNLYTFSLKELTLKQLIPGSLFYWKKFEQEFSWIARVDQKVDNAERTVNWTFYNEHRSWWSTLDELQTFLS